MRITKTPLVTVRTFAAVATCAALVAASSACGGGSARASDGKPSVLASFYPMAWLAERVAGPDAKVTNLTKPGAEPHDLELTPKQTIEVGKASIVTYIKGIQPAVDEAVKEHAGKSGLDAATLVKTLPLGHEDHEDEHSDEHAEHTTEYDPHLWLDPDRLAAVATAFGERLAKADSGYASAYRSRARTVAAELKALDGEFQKGLKPCTQRTIVTSHDAFGYLASRYGLKQISIAGVDPDAEPSPRRIAELTKTVRQAKVSTIFTETLVSAKVAQTLASEAGVKTATLDPVEGLRPGSREDYLSVMRQNLSTLRGALGCQ